MSTSINLMATLFCGQSFAWSVQDGIYQAVVDRRLVLFSEDSFMTVVANNPALFHYFDMGWEYEKAEAYLSGLDSHLGEAIQAFSGLHILNQDPWEVLISFLLSQNNTIKRIRTMYEKLCKTYGTLIENGWYAFPRPKQLVQAGEQDLRNLGMGFRAPYLIDAVEKHALLDTINGLSYEDALQVLMTIRGVGPKVASCILAFAYHRMDAFPMDTWMQKVMRGRYPGRDASYFAPYAALAQQYLFHYERMKGGLS